MFISVLICALAVQGKRKGLFALVAFLGISCIDTLFSTITVKECGISEEYVYSDFIWKMGLNAISLFVLTVVAFFLQKLYFRKRRIGSRVGFAVQQSNGLYLGLLAIGLLSASILISPLSYTDFQWNTIAERMIIFMGYVFVFAFLLIGVLLLFYHRSSKYYREVAKLNQSLLESKERYYQMILEKEEETRRFRHDISSHVTCVRQLLREENLQGAKEYLEDLDGSLGELRLKHQTGSTLINAIVNDMCAKYPEVVLEWQGFLPAETTLSDMDRCTIFSNLLENAFYAASQCVIGKNVDVTVKTVAGALSVIIENDKAGAIEEEKGRFVTQKEDKRNHGFGTRNVKDCVAKNNGTVNFEYTETKFKVTLTLINVV